MIELWLPHSQTISDQALRVWSLNCQAVHGCPWLSMAVHGCWSLIHNISCPSATAQLTLLKQPSCVTKLFTSYVNIYVYIYYIYIYILYIYYIYIYIYTAKLHQIAIFMLFQFMLFSYSSWRYESGIDHGLQAFAKEVAQCAWGPPPVQESVRGPTADPNTWKQSGLWSPATMNANMNMYIYICTCICTCTCTFISANCVCVYILHGYHA